MASLGPEKEAFNALPGPVLPLPTQSTNDFDNALATATRTIFAFGRRVKNAADTAIQAVKTEIQDVSHAICEWAQEKSRQVYQWCRDHPDEVIFILLCIIIPIIIGTCWGPLLGAVGFTASGVAAGSVAAGIQAGLGNVAAGSLFAILTSAGMGGYGVPIVAGVLWGTSSLVCWGLWAWKKWRDS